MNKSKIHDWGVDKTWTLFLDRDGVLNEEKHMDYIRSARELQLYTGVAESFSALNQVFGKVLVVTNQRGIGRDLMSHEDLQMVHNQLSHELELHGGYIDAYYYAPDLNNSAENRKPNTGMAKQAQAQFSEIEFQKSIMIGNNLSDMEFGKRMGMKTVFVETTQEIVMPHEMVDVVLPNLLEFISMIQGMI